MQQRLSKGHATVFAQRAFRTSAILLRFLLLMIDIGMKNGIN
jgi:hypothetical protein